MKPSMRITRIDLDDEEMPKTVSVRMTWDVWDRLCRDHKALRSVAQPEAPPAWATGTVTDWWLDRFPITWVGSTARFYAAMVPDEGTGSEIYRCLSLLCCRFWEGGADDVSNPSESTP